MMDINQITNHPSLTMLISVLSCAVLGLDDIICVGINCKCVCLLLCM